jgi:hypothetical protein
MAASGTGKQGRGYRAWLVRWEWAGDHAKADDPIIAIFPTSTRCWRCDRI